MTTVSASVASSANRAVEISPEQPHRVVPGALPRVVVEPGEQVLGRRVPAPAQVGGQGLQRGEPGLNVPEVGLMRFERNYLITENGYELLTRHRLALTT